MQRPIKKREIKSYHPQEDIALAKRLSERLRQKFGELVKAVILHQPERKLFHTPDPTKPLILSVILDDVSHKLTRQMIDQYIAAAKRIVGDISPRFTIKNIRFSEYWKGVQQMNPTHTLLLREGVVLHDKGFVTPLQMLLAQGRMKPTYEAMNVYFARTQQTMRNARDHMLQATIDLYWACIDSSHALLMHYGYLPPSPRAVGETMRRELVPKKVVTLADCKVMDEMYELYKQIMHKQVTSIEGHHFDALLKKTEVFIRRMGRRLVETGAEPL